MEPKVSDSHKKGKHILVFFIQNGKATKSFFWFVEWQVFPNDFATIKIITVFRITLDVDR